MTNIALDKEPYVVELVVYKVKPTFRDDFHDILAHARKLIQQLPGMLSYRTFRSASNELIFIDFVKWESLELASQASQKVEKMPELKIFMNVFEEIKFMDHLEPFTLFNQHEKLNLVRTKPEYYKAGKDPILIDVDKTDYLMISGMSAPEDEKFLKSIEAIYAMAYAVKFHYKKLGKDFVVAKMEAQWWAEGQAFDQTPREEWNWNLMIPMPDFVTPGVVEHCLEEVIKKKKLSQLCELELKCLTEGQSVQVLHIGSYEGEQESIAKIMEFVKSENLKIDGHHHEIYLSDPMKTPEEKLRTIIRYPVR